MGKALSVLNRQANRYNAENRALKVISLDKPKPAPKHPSSLKYLKEALADQSGIEEISKKDDTLNERLKKVYLTSQTIESKYGKPSDKSRNNLKRGLVEETEFGYVEPVNVAEGKVTLKQAMVFLAEHQSDPKKFSAEVISKNYKIDLKNIEDVLQYFSTFKLYMPPTPKELEGKKRRLKLFHSAKADTIKVETLSENKRIDSS